MPAELQPKFALTNILHSGEGNITKCAYNLAFDFPLVSLCSLWLIVVSPE